MGILPVESQARCPRAESGWKPNFLSMRLIVQKYGGTSVGNPERIRRVAQRLIDTQKSGARVVAVISAMAGVTDNLLKLSRELSTQPTPRELDMLLATGERAATALIAMAINALGGRAISINRSGSRDPDGPFIQQGEDH